MIVKCPWCGSRELKKHEEPKGSYTIHDGLPERFTKDGWIYFVCKDCLKKAMTDSKIDFVFTIIDGTYFLYKGETKTWVPKGIPRERIDFT
jgi:hypothetical protein